MQTCSVGCYKLVLLDFISKGTSKLCFLLFVDWLAEVTGNSSKAFCKVCEVELRTHKNNLTKHAATEKHKCKIKEVRSMANVQSIVEAFKPKITEAQQIAEIRAATFIAKHTALMSADHLMLLLPSIFPDSKIAANFSMQETKCTGLIKNLDSSLFT